MKNESRSQEMINELNQWLKRPERLPLEDFLKQRLDQNELRDVLDTVNEVPKVYQEVQSLRNVGGNINKWLGEQLKPVLTPNATNVEINGVTLDYDTPTQLASKLIHESSTSLLGVDEKGVSELTRDVATSIDELSKQAPEPVQKLLESYFTSEVDAPVDREVVGVLSGSMIRQLRDNPQITSKQLSAVSGAIDHGMFAHKLTYKLAQGQLTPEDVIRQIEDRGASIIGRKARQIVELGLKRGGEALGTWVGSFFGHATTGAWVGKQAGRLAGRVVGPLIEKAAPKIIKVGKKVLTSIGRGVKSMAKAIFGGW